MNFYEKESVSLYLQDLNQLENIYSSKQHIELYKHPELGNILVINDEIQHIENYQCLYHELLVHLPMSFIMKPTSALIIGGGSLFAANEILKYPSIEKVTLCDYDHCVLDVMGNYYDHAKKVMANPKFYFVESDGIDFINQCQNNYDLIINDCFNLVAIGEEKSFSMYKRLKELLTPEGVCCDIIYRHIFDYLVTRNSLKELKELGEIVLSLVTVPEYPGILHIETIWGKNMNLCQCQKEVINQYQQSIISGEKNPFNFFSPDNLPFYLYLPPYIRKMFNV